MHTVPAYERRESMMESPCLHCKRVRDPENCENKLCKDWQAWFIDRWEAMRKHVRAELDATPLAEVGVPLGGRLYSSPHRVREYIRKDPCLSCMYPKAYCNAPCPAKLAWNQSVGEVKP